MAEQSRARRVVRIVVVPLALLGALLTIRRRRLRAGGPRRGDDSGGTAGDREPRNPLPSTLVDAGAGIPSD
jgi:hypothetical protein